MTSRAPVSIDRTSSSKSVVATVTGVDSSDQLFRDSARVIFLKGQKCTYLSRYKPVSNGSVMVEFRGGETWRSNAKVRSCSPSKSEPDTYRVTVELERAHSLVVEDDEADSRPSANVSESKPPAAVADAEADGEPETDDPLEEMTVPAPAPTASSATPSANKSGRTTGGINPAPAPTPAAKAVVADMVRSLVATEVEQWKDTLQEQITTQVEAALQQPLEDLEKRLGKQRPALTEEAVRKIAAQETENAQSEWTGAAKSLVAEAVRSAAAADADRQRKELRALVSEQIEAALHGPVATRLDAKVETAVENKLSEQSRKRPGLTEESARRLAAEVAESVQLEWASTKLQKMVAESVRSALAAESRQRQSETAALISKEVEGQLGGPLAARIDAAVENTLAGQIEDYFHTAAAAKTLQEPVTGTVRQLLETDQERRRQELQSEVAGQIEAAAGGPLAARIDAAIENVLTAKIEGYFQTPTATQSLQERVAKAVHQVLEAEQQQRAQQLQNVVARQIEAAAGGPLAARIDAAIESALAAKIEGHLQSPAAVQSLQELVAKAVHQQLEAEYDRRAQQVQAVVASQIEAAVRGPIATHMDELLRRALDAQRAEYTRNPPPITEDAIRQITAGIAKHPQLQSSLEALSANLLERWTEIARSATATAQKDMNSRITETERLADQVVRDIQLKLNSFNTEMNRILGVQETTSTQGAASPDQPEREKRFRELLQSTGANFEREMKTALQKIFGGS